MPSRPAQPVLGKPTHIWLRADTVEDLLRPPPPPPPLAPADRPGYHVPAMPAYKVVVQRNKLRFAAAHFATFGGDAEPLHGHTYDLIIEVEGRLTADSWVLDFGELKALAPPLCRELDHRFLLPRDNPALSVADVGDAWEGG